MTVKTPDADVKDLEKVIASLSEKKAKVLTPESLKAKEDYDQIKDKLDLQKHRRESDNEDWDDIADFNTNVRLMMTIFQESKFDELIMMLARPMRLFTLQLLMGFVRGMGFALGVLLIGYLTFVMVASAVSPELFQKLAHFLH